MQNRYKPGDRVRYLASNLPEAKYVVSNVHKASLVIKDENGREWVGVAMDDVAPIIDEVSHQEALDLLEAALPILKPDAPLRWYRNDYIRDLIAGYLARYGRTPGEGQEPKAPGVPPV